MLPFKKFVKQREMQQDGCNHHKGGSGAEVFMTGQGSDPNYAIIKHRLPSNLHMVLCQGYGKERHPTDKFDTSVQVTPGY
jgi:hypothetical protein